MENQFITKLIKNRLINVKDYIINNYVKLGLDEKEAMCLIHIYNLSEAGEHFLSIHQLQNKMSLEFVDCSNLVYKLVQKQFIAFDMIIEDSGKRKERFTLEPFYQYIMTSLLNEKDKKRLGDMENEISDLVLFIETEFGRTLSSFEMQMIASWIKEDGYDIGLIKLALKEAIISSAYNLKYVDRILLNWQQKNIRTVEEARDYTKTFKRYEMPKKDTVKNDEEVYVSWMK